MKLLETKSLMIGYPQANGHKVLQQDVDLTIYSGEIVSLMGQNGVGKTTFIKTINGLHPPLSGEVLFSGQNIKSIKPADLAREASLVLTEKPFSFNISVLELIALGRHPYSNWLGILSKGDKKVIEWAFEKTHTHYLANKKLYELSDGQLQKVMIARALAQETNLIILDEPTAHLDLNSKIEVMLLLRDIARSGKGILISTHELQICSQLSDKLWLFNFNEPVQEGTPEDLVLNGALEKTLYLQNHGYDMVHGSVDLPQNGPKVAVQGDNPVKYWTETALKRNEYQLCENAETKIKINGNSWVIATTTKETEVTSIGGLIEALKKTFESGNHH